MREAANARVHAATGEGPAARLEEERGALGPVPTPHGGLLPRHVPEASSRPPLSIAGLQHPLALYGALLAAPMAPEAMRCAGRVSGP